MKKARFFHVSMAAASVLFAAFTTRQAGANTIVEFTEAGGGLTASISTDSGATYSPWSSAMITGSQDNWTVTLTGGYLFGPNFVGQYPGGSGNYQGLGEPEARTSEVNLISFPTSGWVFTGNPSTRIGGTTMSWQSDVPAFGIPANIATSFNEGDRIRNPDGTFTIDLIVADVGDNVPDTTSTLGLVGLSLAALFTVRQKFAAAS